MVAVDGTAMVTVLLALALLIPSSQERGVCRLTSVDKASYMAKNDLVLKRVLLYPRARRIHASSIGQHATDTCLGNESGPPYDHYNTWWVYSLPRSVGRRAIVSWYRRHLAPTWTWRAGTGADATFRHGNESLYVSAFDGRTFALVVDYSGYRR
jgi:hypothetical protein